MKIFPYFSKVFYSPLAVKCIARNLHHYLNTDTRFVVHKFDEQEFVFDIKANSYFCIILFYLRLKLLCLDEIL